MKYMLDTNICIFIMKNKIDVVNKYTIKKHLGISISVITLAELQHGVAGSSYIEKSAKNLADFLTGFDILNFDSSAAIEYGKICADLYTKGIPIGPMDMLIGAHAKSEGLTLVTNNIREFSRIDGLNIEDWTE